MTTKREKILCPFCYDQVLKELETGALDIEILRNFDDSVHDCLDKTTNKTREEIVKPIDWLRCVGCGEQKKTVMRPQEHPTAEYKIKCFECNFVWYVSKEELFHEFEL